MVVVQTGDKGGLTDGVVVVMEEGRKGSYRVRRQAAHMGLDRQGEKAGGGLKKGPVN